MSPYYADTMHWQPLGYPALYIIISIMIIIIKVATVMVTSRQHCHVLPPFCITSEYTEYPPLGMYVLPKCAPSSFPWRIYNPI